MLQHDLEKPASDPVAGSELPHGAQTSQAGHVGMLGNVGRELKKHVPFTLIGTLTGIVIMATFTMAQIPQAISAGLFWGLHPLHVFLSALVTTAMYALHGRRSLWATIAIGYVGSVGIATVSDCVIPYAGEYLLGLPNRELHLGFIEKWWLVNPLAALGILAGVFWPKTKLTHAGHVLISTWASLFHMTMASGGRIHVAEGLVIAVFLFLAVWIPCCTSDIVFPLLFCRSSES